MIALNGRIIAQGSQFSLNDVEVISATIDIEDVRAHRASSSRSMQAAQAERYHRIEVPVSLSRGKFEEVREEDMVRLNPQQNNLGVKYHSPEEEIACVCRNFVVELCRANASLNIAWVPHAGCGII
jgi:NAD+ synthase (glutamine-hydrolysing)